MRYYYAVVSYDMGDPNKGDHRTCSRRNARRSSRRTARGNAEVHRHQLRDHDPECGVGRVRPAAGRRITLESLAGYRDRHDPLDVLDPGAIKDAATYRLLFDASGAIPKYTTSAYSLVRINTSGSTDTLMSHLSSTFFGPSVFSSPFDGLTFTYRNDTTVTIIDTSAGWLVGTPGVFVRPMRDNLNIAKDVAWPGDYELRWYSTPVDTAVFDAPPRFPKMAVNFHITNTTSGNRTKFIIDDADRSGTVSFGDTIRIVEGYVNSTTYSLSYMLTWDRGPGINPQPPQDGDRFVFRTRKPFAQGDYFEFRTHAARVDAAQEKNQLSRIDVVPNPYVAAASWERKTLFSTGRGDRKIEFIHLPAQCTIRIYTVAGYLVKTLVKDSNMADGSMPWDLVTDDGMNLAYGLYLYHVDAPGIGSHIGKFAVIN